MLEKGKLWDKPQLGDDERKFEFNGLLHCPLTKYGKANPTINVSL